MKKQVQYFMDVVSELMTIAQLSRSVAQSIVMYNVSDVERGYTYNTKPYIVAKQIFIEDSSIIPNELIP